MTCAPGAIHDQAKTKQKGIKAVFDRPNRDLIRRWCAIATAAMPASSQEDTGMTPYGDWQLRFFPSVNYAIFAQRERKTRIKSTGHPLGFGTPTAYGGTQRAPTGEVQIAAGTTHRINGPRTGGESLCRINCQAC